MKVLLLNQFFHPDLSATAQIATDVAEDLVAVGLEVTAVATRGSYLGGERLPARDSWRGVAIRRLWATSLGKRTLLHRALDYGSFHASAALAMAAMPRHDVVLALTIPPLIAAAGLVARSLKGTKLVYWVQDLYPEVAVAFGARSPAARLMGAVSRAVLSRADRVVALGRHARAMCRRRRRSGADGGPAELGGRCGGAPGPAPGEPAAAGAGARRPLPGHVLGEHRARPRPHHALISEFERQTGVGLVLNTSFNEHEPIVASPADAIACYQKTRMDVLALGNWVLSRHA
jgi:hypothetical protein